MNAYVALFTVSFWSKLEHRAAAFASMWTQVFWAILRCKIFEAFYSHAQKPVDMKLEDIVAYVWICQIILRIIPWHVDKDLQKMICDGNVSYELVRPWNVGVAWFFRILGAKTAQSALSAIPVFFFAFFVWDIPLPKAPTFFFFALFGALMFSAVFTTFMTLGCFWTISSAGFVRLLPHLIPIFSGMVMPISLFPDQVQLFMRLQPFCALFDTPARIYLGDCGALLFAHQWLWFCAFAIASKCMLDRILRKVVISGG